MVNLLDSLPLQPVAALAQPSNLRAEALEGCAGHLPGVRSVCRAPQVEVSICRVLLPVRHHIDPQSTAGDNEACAGLAQGAG